MSIWENIHGVWEFLITITETAPLSVWQFAIAVIVPAALFRYLQRMPCRYQWDARWGRNTVDWGLETIALVVGIALAWVPWRTTAGLLIGICAGLLSPYITRGVIACFVFARHYLLARLKRFAK